MNDRAISQSVGFALTFAVIISGVALTSVVGFDQLENFREAREIDNAEQSMVLIKDNLDEIQDGRALARSGDIDLERGRLGWIPAGESRLRISIQNVTGEPPDRRVDYDETLEMRALRYSLGDTAVAYEGGALFRSHDRTGPVMQATPSFVCREDLALISVVTLDSESQRQLGGGTVGVQVEHNHSSLRFPVNRSGRDSLEGRANVTVEIADSRFEDAWHSYFEAQPGWSDDGGGRFVCSGLDSYQVVRTGVTVSFIR